MYNKIKLDIFIFYIILKWNSYKMFSAPNISIFIECIDRSIE